MYFTRLNYLFLIKACQTNSKRKRQNSRFNLLSLVRAYFSDVGGFVIEYGMDRDVGQAVHWQVPVSEAFHQQASKWEKRLKHVFCLERGAGKNVSNRITYCLLSHALLSKPDWVMEFCNNNDLHVSSLKVVAQLLARDESGWYGHQMEAHENLSPM
ncbi:hypothetical protein Tco_0694579 [Tanacetum coccineum]